MASREEIVISRGPCFGFCPVYTVNVTPGGQVNFEGARHTALVGQRTSAVSRRVYENVRREVEVIRPPTGTTRDWHCDRRPTDTSNFTIEWKSADGVQTSLRYAVGCDSAEGRMIERLIERQLQRLGVAEWAKQTTREGASRG